MEVACESKRSAPYDASKLELLSRLHETPTQNARGHLIAEAAHQGVKKHGIGSVAGTDAGGKDREEASVHRK